MTQDLNKGIFNITYNHLNLPVKIDFSQGKPLIKEITYRYDATGVKLEKSVKDGTTIKTQYAGGFIYNNNGGDQKLQFFSHPEGYVEPVGGTERSVKGFEIGQSGPTYSSYNYVFQYKDHLGNVRLSYSDADLDGTISPDEIIEESNYYPFGMKHKGYNNVVNGTEHPYTYNGKEEQNELGLNWLDYGARNYMSDLGRYFNMDRLSEAYVDLNPYQYTANNPVKFIDVNGDYIYIWDENEKYRYENGEVQKQSEGGKWETHQAKDGGYLAQILEFLGDITGGDENSFGSKFLSSFENDDVNVELFNNTSQGAHKDKNITQNTDIHTSFNQKGSIKTTGWGSERISKNFHVTLFHELGHGFANNVFSKSILRSAWISNVQVGENRFEDVSKSEVYASMDENMLRAEQGLNLRTHYIGGTADNRSRLIIKSKTQSPFSKTYQPTEATMLILNEILKSRKE